MFFLQGALTHGDRRATESQDLSRYNFDNKVAAVNVLSYIIILVAVCIFELTGLFYSMVELLWKLF